MAGALGNVRRFRQIGERQRPLARLERLEDINDPLDRCDSGHGAAFHGCAQNLNSAG
ncbi:hypothetical protein D3C80_2051880 [compost metagenome]